MVTYVQRRKKLEALRPRQPWNDQNAGSMREAASGSADEGGEGESRQQRYMRQCAKRHLI